MYEPYFRVTTQDGYGRISLPVAIERAHAQTVHTTMHDNKVEVQGSNSHSTIVRCDKGQRGQ